jgi:glycosyltransferase involved in cell wall biosynthesis
VSGTAAVLSFRLGGTDGVSIEAAKWAGALRALGFSVRTVAGEGEADVIVSGLAREATAPPERGAVEDALEGIDVVLVENLLSLPMNRPAAGVVARALAGRPAVLRHHDLPWQRPHYAHLPPPPDDRRWAHVTINDLSRRELQERAGIVAFVRHNRFPLEGWDAAPVELAVDGPLVLHPVRAIARKGIATAIRLAEALGATYWLTGAAEDGFEAELEALLDAAGCPVIRRPVAAAASAYAACDVVAFPSTAEGFGNPVVESALARRPLAIARYPVSEELAAFGFRWLDAADPDAVRRFLAAPDPGLIDDNERIARAGFGLDRLPAEVAEVLERVL